MVYAIYIMDTLLELRTAVQSDLTVNSESTLFAPTIIDLAINRSYRKAGALFKWSETEDAQKTSTVSGQEYYDYPDNWRPNSAWKLVVDDEDYDDPLAFKDYLYEKENDIPCGADYLWSQQWRRFFLYPTPTANGNNNMTIWGIKVVDKLVNDGDTTIFSYAMPDCNEAVVLEAVAILKAKGEDEKSGMFRSAEAKGLLANAWQKIRAEEAKFEKTQPLLNVPDFFGKSGATGYKYSTDNF